MKIKMGVFSLLLLVGLALVSCCSTEEPVPLPGRTVLVYMAADNNLSSYSYANIRSMLTGAEGNNLNNGNLLVYHDSSAEPPRLLHIKKGEGGVIEEVVIRTYEDRNSVSIEVMRSVLDEVFQNEAYKAESYGLLLWSHGTAWLPADFRTYLRAYGQDKSNFMEIYELEETLRGYHFDFIIFDDCYMANIEVAYTLRDKADYILASPTEILADGLPYRYIVEYLFSGEPVQNALTKAGERFYTYYENQEAGGQNPKSASVALVKTEKLEALAAVCREILAGKEEEAFFELPLENIQLIERLGYAHHALYDFGDFIKQLASPEQYKRFEDALKEVVVYKNTTDIAYYMAEGGLGGFVIDRERFCGISTYVPQEPLAKLNEWYKRLDWYNAVYE
ncbi:MAG: hypothetical protein LBS88_12965 [Tannerellaceae bacterium]|jgi:hypothetical protein|nr:hypothetical protein [Tannerellaceae bacterium]